MLGAIRISDRGVKKAPKCTLKSNIYMFKQISKLFDFIKTLQLFKHNFFPMEKFPQEVSLPPSLGYISKKPHGAHPIR